MLLLLLLRRPHFENHWSISKLPSFIISTHMAISRHAEIIQNARLPFCGGRLLHSGTAFSISILKIVQYHSTNVIMACICVRMGVYENRNWLISAICIVVKCLSHGRYTLVSINMQQKDLYIFYSYHMPISVPLANISMSPIFSLPIFSSFFFQTSRPNHSLLPKCCFSFFF